MSLLHYFSDDANKRANFIFDLIAPVYGMADEMIQKSYKQSMKLLVNEIDINNKSVLDLGTGTGAWAAMFSNNQGTTVHGIDISLKMLSQSRKKNPGIKFSQGNIENLTTIENSAFDIVTASYVIHGVKTDRRLKIISEMERVSKHYVIIHDFMGRTPMLVSLLERLEKSDYKQFKLNIVTELKTKFSEVIKIPGSNGSGLYIAIK